VLKQTSQEDVERTLLFSPEFSKSEKKKGIFFYSEKIRTEAEVATEELIEIPTELPSVEEKPAAPGEAHLAIGTIEEEVPAPPAEDEIIVVEEEVVEVKEKVEKPVEEPTVAEMPTPPTKEKADKKKKEAPPKKKKKERRRIEGEAVPRRRKGEKKFIEERIELEESEIEALVAVKEERAAKAERVSVKDKKKKKEEFQAPATEEPTFGIFAEKLKVALDKHDKPKKTKKKTEGKQKKETAKKAEKKPAK
jgi:hypothetical protein